MSAGITPLKRKNKEVIRIAFSFKGVQCRETLDLPGTKANMLYAERLRAEILGKIERGSFLYNEYFPDSPRCKVFGHVGGGKTASIKELLTDYKSRSKTSLQPSTWNGYRKAIDNILIPEFGHLQLSALNTGVLRDWIAARHVTRKRMSNLLLPMRNALAEAVADEKITYNPLDRLKLAKILPRDTLQTDYEPDPYTVEELLTLFDFLDGQERNAIQFWAFTGVRTSELVAVSWPDCDKLSKAIKIDKAVVEGAEKTTKTKAGIRLIPLLLAARQALEAQRKCSELAGGRIFPNPRTGGEWTDQSLLRLWQRTCKLAKIRYRNPYQLRHTFASHLLSQGENPAYIAKLLGHKNTEMVIRTYGRWVEQGASLGFDKPPAKYGTACLPGLPDIDDGAKKCVRNV
nr:tyrosine-type recombinase/integrase [uncultured Albidiferax sp.]